MALKNPTPPDLQQMLDAALRNMREGLAKDFNSIVRELTCKALGLENRWGKPELDSRGYLASLIDEKATKEAAAEKLNEAIIAGIKAYKLPADAKRDLKKKAQEVYDEVYRDAVWEAVEEHVREQAAERGLADGEALVAAMLKDKGAKA